MVELIFWFLDFASQVAYWDVKRERRKELAKKRAQKSSAPAESSMFGPKNRAAAS